MYHSNTLLTGETEGGREGVYGNSQYFLLNFSVNLKLPPKIKSKNVYFKERDKDKPTIGYKV